ncbi:Hypothetical protein A7982_10110 [Minicystis rosea]|nr:Hypothetical protein A7982_10110 [Minicystis rosea]
MKSMIPAARDAVKRSPTSLRCASIVASLVFAAIAIAPVPAGAQATKDLSAARKAFREGEEAEAKGDNETALARFRAALAVKETPQIHLRVGAIEEKLGKLRDALASYQHGLDLAAALPAVAKVAREQIDALAPRIPTVVVSIAKPPPGLVVTLDGAPLAAASFGAPQPIDPGAHRIHAEAPGRAARDESFTVVERSSARVDLDLAPIVATAPGTTSPPSSKVPGVIAAGGGAAALVAGAILVGISVGRDSGIDVQCGGADRQRCPLSKKDQIESDVRAINAMRFSGLGVTVLGAASVAIGTYLLVNATKPPPSVGAVTFAPFFGAGTAGVTAAGRF